MTFRFIKKGNIIGAKISFFKYSAYKGVKQDKKDLRDKKEG